MLGMLGELGACGLGLRLFSNWLRVNTMSSRDKDAIVRGELDPIFDLLDEEFPGASECLATDKVAAREIQIREFPKILSRE